MSDKNCPMYLDRAVANIRKLEAEAKVHRKRIQELWERTKSAEDKLKATAKWIPVSERLPEKWGSNITFLIFITAGNIQTSWYSKEEGWDYMDVSHWMPLPEPPKALEGL